MEECSYGQIASAYLGIYVISPRNSTPYFLTFCIIVDLASESDQSRTGQQWKSKRNKSNCWMGT